MRRTVSTIAASCAAVLVLAACGGDSEEPSGPQEPESSPEVTESNDSSPSPTEGDDEPTSEPGAEDESTDDGTEDEGTEDEGTEDEGTEDEGTASGSGDLTAAPWTGEILTPGEELGVITDGTIEVTVYQVGVAPAPKDGRFVDPDSNEPLIAEGDDIVYVNYVITNVGEEAIPLGSSLVAISPEYIDWPWMQGMDGITDSALAEEMGISTRTIHEIADPTVYPLAPGETYAYGENFAYQPGTELIVSVRYTPVDDEGDLVHDERQEFEGSVVID